MDEEIGGSTKSPKIEYPFVPQLMNSYEELQTKFVNGTEVIVNKSGWRDDMKFLHHLTLVFKFYEEKGHFPLVNFQKIPNISNAKKSAALFHITGQSIGLLINFTTR